MKKCNICKRELDNPSDPFSIDCGGDCIWCMIPIEFDVGDYETTNNLLQQIIRRVFYIEFLDERGEEPQ